MVLGVNWLRQYIYSPIVFAFQKLQINFTKEGCPVTLIGVQEEATLKHISSKSIQKLRDKKSSWCEH